MYGEIVKLIERSEEQRTTKDLRWSKASGGRSKRDAYGYAVAFGSILFTYITQCFIYM